MIWTWPSIVCKMAILSRVCIEISNHSNDNSSLRGFGVLGFWGFGVKDLPFNSFSIFRAPISEDVGN